MINDFGEYDENTQKTYDLSEQSKIAQSYFNATGLQGEVKSKKIPVTSIDATYFAQVFTGGNSVIVDSSGSSLFAKNGITPQAHLEAFLKGKRTQAPYFNNLQNNRKTENIIQKKAVKNDDSNNKYVIDEETGKRYKKLPNAPSEAIKAHKNNKESGLTLDQARKYITLDEDFNVDDLASTAELFMGHLRVAPNKEEIAALRVEREQRMKAMQVEQQKQFDIEEKLEREEQEQAFHSDLKFN